MSEWISVKDRLPESQADVLVVAFWHERWQTIWAGIVTWERSGVSLHHTEKESRAVSPTGCPSQTRRRRDSP